MVTSEQRAVAAAQRDAAVVASAGCARRWHALWRALDAVPDPEVPVVSVHELGMVRGLVWDEADPATLVVRLTPTYSGCPATEADPQSIVGR